MSWREVGKTSKCNITLFELLRQMCEMIIMFTLKLYSIIIFTVNPYFIKQNEVNLQVA